MENLKKEQFKKLIALNIFTLTVLLVIAAAALGIKYINSRLPHWLYIPYCLTHDLFHLYCPFCGCTRAGLALLRLDVAGSFAANPTVILFCFEYLVYNAVAAVFIFKGKKIPELKRWGIATGIFFILFFAVRNILMIFFGFDTLGELVGFWR